MRCKAPATVKHLEPSAGNPRNDQTGPHVRHTGIDLFAWTRNLSGREPQAEVA